MRRPMTSMAQASSIHLLKRPTSCLKLAFATSRGLLIRVLGLVQSDGRCERMGVHSSDRWVSFAPTTPA